MAQTLEQKKRELENTIWNRDGWKYEYLHAKRMLTRLNAKIVRLEDEIETEMESAQK